MHTQPRRHIRSVFTLMELLIVVATIALLVAILLPALARSRDSARTLTCATHLRAIATAITTYANHNSEFYPLAYSYAGTTIDRGVQLPQTPTAGIVPWSTELIRLHLLTEPTLLCPSMSIGGLPPANPSDADRLPGQVNLTPGVIDDQPSRSAYTVNEALCPRNRLVVDFEKAITPSRSVNISRIEQPAQVILATEWTSQWSLVHTADTPTGICQSYLPVNGFAGMGPMPTADRYDMNGIGNPHPCPGDYRQLTTADIASDPQTVAGSTRLDWVGRNHGSRTGDTVDMRSSNFAYADGHVQTQSIYKTLTPFAWGERLYWAGTCKMQ